MKRKVAIVGVEGSGKTVLMAALAERYAKVSESELYFYPENETAHGFMLRVPHQLRVKREWPQATTIDGFKTLRWSLRRGNAQLAEVEMLDYPGEIYRMAFGADKSKETVAAHRLELDEFLGHVTDATHLVVLLNLDDLTNTAENQRKVEAVWITQAIFAYARRTPTPKKLALVFTQYDRYRAEYSSYKDADDVLRKLPVLQYIAVDNPNLECSFMSAVSDVDTDGRPAVGNYSVGLELLMNFILPVEHEIIFNEVEELLIPFQNETVKEWAEVEVLVAKMKELEDCVRKTECARSRARLEGINRQIKEISEFAKCVGVVLEKKPYVAEKGECFHQELEQISLAYLAPWTKRVISGLVNQDKSERASRAAKESKDATTFLIILGVIFVVFILIVIVANSR